MRLLTVSSIEEASNTLIVFRFDSAPSGAESFVLDWIDEEEVAHTATVNGLAVEWEIILRHKFPANKFTLTHTATNTRIPFELDTNDWAKELTFINENNEPVFYLPAHVATRINQLVVRKINGDTWTTLYRGTQDYRLSYGTGEDLIRLTVPNDRPEDNQQLKDLRKAVITVHLDRNDAVVSYSDLVPLNRGTKETVSHEGLLDFDKLGII